MPWQWPEARRLSRLNLAAQCGRQGETQCLSNAQQYTEARGVRNDRTQQSTIDAFRPGATDPLFGDSATDVGQPPIPYA